MKNFFKELLEYTHHYNQQLADTIIANPDRVSEKVISLFSHIINAQQIWNNRIDAREKTFDVWQLHPVEAFKDLDRKNYEHSVAILEKVDLDDVRHYTNSRGDAFSNSVRDMLFQAINHTTYHRAQIATEFKQHGLAPLLTDFIVYKR